MLDPLDVGGDPLTLTVKGKNEVKFEDVLIGEIWICSGQSNMQWSFNQANDPDLEKAAAKHPKLRMINFSQTGSQELNWSHHDRQWQAYARKCRRLIGGRLFLRSATASDARRAGRHDQQRLGWLRV